MTTTVLRDSMVGDQWIRDCYSLNPVRRVIDPKTQQPNGNILTGPVRLAFCDALFEARAAANNPQGPKKFGTNALYTPFTDFTIIYEEYYKACAATFPEFYNPNTQQYNGLHSPFRDQAEKAHQYAGFTPGCIFLNHTSKFMPQVVDIRGNPITDRNRVYAGAWAILAINAYPYGKNPPQPKKGVGFGLQQVMIIGDDTKLAGGAPDPRVTFAGVNVKPPIAAPAAAFGAAPPLGPQGAPPPAGGMYPPHGSVPAPLGAAPLPPMPAQPPPMAAADDTDVSEFM